MDVKIENIIEKLKKEGVEKAQKASEQILADAKKKADQMIATAQKDAEKIMDDAKKQAASFEESSRVALKQAARDGELLLKRRIQALFDTVFKASAGEAMQPEFMQKLIYKLVEQWSDKDLEISVSEKDLKSLKVLLFAGMKKKVKTGIELKASADLQHGFRVGIKGDDVYYDFTDDSIAEILRMSLNPRLKKMLDKEDG
jgi:V/A-type H+-transporting ATPase subunit E